jgi:NAD(P)H-hydrate epimerase
MENAGRGAAELLLRLGCNGRVIICAGKGNNAGDGFVIARHLENRGVDVVVWLFGNPEDLRGDAAVNFTVLRAAKTPIRVAADLIEWAEFDHALNESAWVVDALLGTGMTGDVREPLKTVIVRINAASNPRKLAIDLPSGMDCDTGRPLGCSIRANHRPRWSRKVRLRCTGAADLTRNCPRDRHWNSEGTRELTCFRTDRTENGAMIRNRSRVSGHVDRQRSFDLPRLSIPEIPELPAALEDLLRQIPAGRVATYGGLAEALGSKTAARWVGEYLREHKHSEVCVCHRVVRIDGSIGLYITGESDDKLRRLRAENIPIRNGRVDLNQCHFDDFDSTQPLAALIEWQRQIAKRVRLSPMKTVPDEVAGLDVAYAAPGKAVGVYVLYDLRSSNIVWSNVIERPAPFPYIPGLLTFRELPVFIELLEAARDAERTAPLLFVDGNGILHPRRSGIATAVGIVAGVPTIGVGKKLLCGRVDGGSERSKSCGKIRHEDELIGVAIQHNNKSRPIYVSPGNLIDVPTAAEFATIAFHVNTGSPSHSFWLMHSVNESPEPSPRHGKSLCIRRFLVIAVCQPPNWPLVQEPSCSYSEEWPSPFDCGGLAPLPSRCSRWTTSSGSSKTAVSSNGSPVRRFSGWSRCRRHGSSSAGT